MNDYMALLREQWSDPLLTALTVLLVVMLFVVAPCKPQGSSFFRHSNWFLHWFSLVAFLSCREAERPPLRCWSHSSWPLLAQYLD
jgi:hypothetical protein